MKSTIIKSLLVALATVIVPLTSQSAGAQEANAGLVAVLDVARVFKVNQAFVTKMSGIKDEAELLKGQITQEQEAIKAQAQQLTQYDVGTPDRNKLEANLEQQQTTLRTKARQSEAELLNREARIYYETYRQMQSVVATLAAQNKVSLVLRFDSEPIDPNNRTEVIKGVNRAVVYHGPYDLTDMVINAMGPRVAEANASTQNK